MAISSTGSEQAGVLYDPLGATRFNSGGTTSTTSYYYLDGQRIAISSGGTFLYLGNDVLNSPTAALTASGTLYGARLYAPYGAVRYASGNWPAAGGYTGQWADGPSGLNYDVARYYDTGVGQFTSADPVNAGLDRYGYVHDNPETYIDPSGHTPKGCIEDEGNYYCPGNNGGNNGNNNSSGSNDNSTGNNGCSSEVCSSGGYPGLTPQQPQQQQTQELALKQKKASDQPNLTVHHKASMPLPWYDWKYISQWLVAGVMVAGAIALILAGLAAQPTDPVGLVSFANGLDLLIRAVTMMAGIIWGVKSAAYKGLVGVEAIADTIVDVVDVAAISMLTGGADSIPALFAALGENPAATAAVGTAIGVDLTATITDYTGYFTDSFHLNNPAGGGG